MTIARRSEWTLAGVLALEFIVFSAAAPNFATAGNAAEIVRLAVEIGLLALALTPIVIAGGIDLSSGALLALAAIVLGGLWRDAGWPIWLAAAAALAVGAAGGALNAWFVARWRLPPLMVTLGSLSLFRGLAEGLTGGVDNYTSLPPHFLALGQGFAGAIPLQAPVLLAAALGIWLLVHRTTRGRVYFAVGNNEQAARFAGVDVARHLAELYILSGLAAGLAAIIYVAHLGQAKADAGTGYELTAVTAVVLGGTAINRGIGQRPGDAARAGGDGGPPERAATRRVARGAGGHPDWRAPGWRDWAARAQAAAPIGAPASDARGRDAELSAGGALRRHPGRRADRGGQQLVAGALPSRRPRASILDSCRVNG